jgi:phospholipid-transporting ATPase
MTVLHKNPNRDERIVAHEFFLTLAACNTVIPILTDGEFSGCGTSESNGYAECIDYQGESPDEQALVSAASAYGYTLFERTSGHIVIDINGEKLR